MNQNYIFLAEGFEELEALTVVDVLRRAGMPIVMVSVNDTPYVTGAHGVTFQADALYTQTRFNDADWLILPGGLPGASNLHKCDALNELLRTHFADGGNVAAICASPAVVLAPIGLLKDRSATCYPGFEKDCLAAGAKKMHDSPVIIDRNLITGNGPASAMRFALTIVQQSCGEAKAQEVGSGLLYYQKTMNFYF